MLSTSDKNYIETTIDTKIDGFSQEMNEKLDRLLTMVSNNTGEITKIEKNTAVLSYHNSQHFDKDEEQDKRLTRVESHLELPAFA